MRFKFLKIVMLCCIPLLLLFVIISIKSARGPYWLAQNSDPEYAYLLNSLNLTQFKPVGLIYHPGTTFQVIGSGVLLFVHALRGGNLVTDVLTNPEFYLNAISYLLITMSVLSFLLAGLFTLFITGDFVLSLVIQLTPFLSVTSLETLNRVFCEPLLLITGLWFSVLVLMVYYIKKVNWLTYTLIFGLISGFFIATKIDAIPIIAIPVAILPPKNKVTYILVSFVSFIFFTLPIYKQYFSFIDWVYRLSIHSGIYAQGEANIINFHTFFGNIIAIFTSEQILSLLFIGTMAMLLILASKRLYGRWYNLLTGFLLFYILQIIIVAKHFGLHYLIPSLSLSGLVSVVLLVIIEKIYPSAAKKFKCVFFVVLGIVVASNIVKINRDDIDSERNFRDAQKLRSFIETIYQGHIRVSYYQSSSPEYALRFGSDFANSPYGKELSALYPKQYFYDIWNKVFYDWNGTTTLPKNSGILFQGTPFKDSYQSYKPDLKLEDVYGGNKETVYLLKP